MEKIHFVDDKSHPKFDFEALERSIGSDKAILPRIAAVAPELEAACCIMNVSLLSCQFKPNPEIDWLGQDVFQHRIQAKCIIRREFHQ